jgi:predicted transcriptional regulator
MEIKELVSYYINETSHMLEVTFKTLTDSEDEIRTDQIVLDEIETFGYNILNNINENFFEDDDEEFEDMFNDFEEEELDEEEIISFLNEYYLIYPKKLPEAQLF